MNRSKILPPTYLLIALAAMASLHFLVPIVKIFPFPWNTLGILFLFSGVALNLISDRRFHQAGTTVKPFETSSTLITNGVFRLSRNTMYLGFALLLGGVAIFLGSLSALIVLPIFAVLIEKNFIIREEKSLEKTFGQVYLDYKRKVRRWI
jgi:protein-S-isoprenylcysteine O-methyltransferase Ste14